MSVLVVGSERVDTGEMTFATGLIARTGGIGFKPRAANDCWFDHADYRAAVEAGRLYGKDTSRLAATNRGSTRPKKSTRSTASGGRLQPPEPGFSVEKTVYSDRR